MRNVRCPRCKNEHRLAPDAPGYVCPGCGTEWVFARCQQCHSTFHAPAGTASWTCRRCGFRNVGPPAREAVPQPPRSAPFLRSARARWGRLAPRTRVALVVIPVLVAALVAGVLLSGGGGGGSIGSRLAAAKESYCLHSRALAQELDRAPAITRATKQIRRDEAAFRSAGDTTAAGELRAIVRAGKRLAAAIDANKGTRAATRALEKATLAGPSC